MSVLFFVFSVQVRKGNYVNKLLDRFGPAVGQGMSLFLSTGNISSVSGLDLMQVRVVWLLSRGKVFGDL